jgi:hypothetical protein
MWRPSKRSLPRWPWRGGNMNRYWKPATTALIVALVAAGLFAGPARGDAMAAALPKDPCALLKPADIQALAPNAKIGSGVPTSNAPLGASCAYNWGPRTNEWGQTSLTVIVVDASKVWPGGLSAADIKERVLVEVKTDGPDASEISGIGDGAVFTTNPKSHDATAKAYLVKAKGLLLEVTFHGGNALAQKDKLIALVKAAAAAL